MRIVVVLVAFASVISAPPVAPQSYRLILVVFSPINAVRALVKPDMLATKPTDKESCESVRLLAVNGIPVIFIPPVSVPLLDRVNEQLICTILPILV